MEDRQAGMRRLPTLEDRVPPQCPRLGALRPSRVRLGVVLVVAAYPAAVLAQSTWGVDGRLVFAVLWLAAAISQAPTGGAAWDRVALGALALYVVAFALPAGVATSSGGASPQQLLGYQVFGMPPVGPLPHLPGGGIVATLVGLTVWLANPLFVLAVAVFRHREGTLAMVLASAAVIFGVLELPAIDLAIGHALWLGAPVALAAAAAWARRSW